VIEPVVGGPVRIVGRFLAVCLNTGDHHELPLGTVGTITSVLSQWLVDVLFQHDGKSWMGANLFVDSEATYLGPRGDVETIDVVTAIGRIKP
jgi:hypothetical protein